ncbi:RidA family protein [soil metagenome]
MPKQVIKTEKAPLPVAPYSQGIIANGFLYISGQICTVVGSNEMMNENITIETQQVMRHLQAILEAAKLTFEHVVKTTIFLSSMDYFAEVNDAYGAFFNGDFPARETIAVRTLPRNVNVEISMIAAVYL